MGESTDAVAKMAPAATEVKSFPVIVNLPFILMGMLRHTRMLTSASGTFVMPAVVGPVLEAMAQGGIGSVKSCRNCVVQLGNKRNMLGNQRLLQQKTTGKIIRIAEND
jgi:hypothetical protein